jgi:hypothetical protein
MSDFLVALGLVFAIEGFLYAAFPAEMRGMMERARALPDATLRVGGLVAFACGVAVVLIVRG